MKLKNLILGLALAMSGLFAQAQTGLENVIVEKYYVANAADAAASTGILPVGSVTYRIYADMLPGYKFQAAYGTSTHTLKVTTTTSFFNNEDRGSTSPTYTKAQTALNTVMLDSWLSVGAGCAGYFGVPLSEDNGVNTTTHPAGVLTALNANDGLLIGAPEAITLVGPQVSSGVSIFDATSQAGNSFLITDGAWSALSGAAGPIPATNRVLIGQFTTDGIFHFELNMQLGTSTGGTEKFVVSNAVDASETVKSFLSQTFYPTPQFPTISVTVPADGANFAPGAAIILSANAADVDGTVSQVEFFVDGVSKGLGTLSAGVYSLTLSTGLIEKATSYSVTAKATDNDGQVTTSAAISINVGNAAPSATLTAPLAGAIYVLGDPVTVSATATDPDGSVVSVEFFNGAISLGNGTLAAGVYSLTFTPSVAGPISLTAKATDNLGKVGPASAARSITVNANQLPIVAISAPANGSKPDIAADLVINATATDADGTVTKVEFFKGAVSLGVGTKSGNVYSLTVPKANLVLGPMTITAVATDNKGGVTTSAPVNVIITNYSIAYAIGYVKQECYKGTVCMPVTAVMPVSGVIGYNFTIAYDKTKVNPTGAVTVSPALLGTVATTLTTVDTYIDAAAGTIAVSIYFKGSAPVTAAFNGTGDICCVQFDQLPAFTGDATTAFSFTNPGVTESYPTLVLDQPGQDGTFEIFRDWFLYSNLKNWSDGQPIKYDPLNTAAYLVTNILGQSPQGGAAGAAVQPDLNGTFKYDIRNGLKIDIQRDILNSTLVNSVIEGADAYTASVVSLGNPAYTPQIYNIIAMDVNRDQRITAGDATQINRRSVNIIQEFTQVGNEHKDWLFVAKTVADNDPAYKISSTFPQSDGTGYSKAKVPYISKFQDVKYNADYQVCPSLLTSEDYLGVMVGDADGSYAGITHDGLLKSADAATTSEIVIDLSKAKIVNGDIQLPVSLYSADAVTSYSFQLTLNDNVQVNSIVSTVGANLDWNFVPQYKALLVSTYASGGYTIPTVNSVADISVKGVGAISISDLTGVVSKINGIDVDLKVIDAATGINERTKDVDVQVYPNPASDRLNIEVSKDSKVQIIDLNGKRIGDSRNVNANQKEVIDVTNLAPGVYMVKVYNEKSVVVKKVVIKK
jgi:hypothetical protein